VRSALPSHEVERLIRGMQGPEGPAERDSCTGH
jgi:hypothetical protein